MPGKSVKNTYHPIEMKKEYKSKKMCNIPYYFYDFLIFDDKALNCMSELLDGANVEVLPIKCAEKNLYAINILDDFSVDEALDLTKSKLEYHEDSGGLAYVKKYVFKESEALKKDLFKVFGHILASDKFKQIVEDNELTGVYFAKKWDSEVDD
jgi:hypothetical protein